MPLIQPVSAVGGFTKVKPTIDGVIQQDEWANAERKNIVLAEVYIGTLYVMNDLVNLYVAIELNAGPKILIFFGDDVFGFDPRTGTYLDGVAISPTVCRFDGHIDGQGASTSEGGKTYYEFSKPLNSGDPDDLNIPEVPSRFPYYLLLMTELFSFGADSGTIELKSPMTVRNVRHPDKVEVGQSFHVMLDIEYDLGDCEYGLVGWHMSTTGPLDLERPPVFTWTSSGEVQEGGVPPISGRGSITVEIVFKAIPPPGSIDVNVGYTFSSRCESVSIRVSSGYFSIEKVDDLEITPDAEGICIWDGPPPPESAPPSTEIDIPVKVKYAVDYEAWMNIGVYDENGVLVSTVKYEETVTGIGYSDYTFKVKTPNVEGPWRLKVSLYYGHVEGVDSIHKECDEWPFTVIVSSGVPGGVGVKILSVDSPSEVDSGGGIEADVNVEYDLPSGSKYRVSILDATSGMTIQTSAEKTAASHDFETFNFQNIFAPIQPQDGLLRLVAIAEYKTDGGWQILEPDGIREFSVMVHGSTLSPGELPVGPGLQSPPLPTDMFPPPPAGFDFTLEVTPSDQEASAGKTVNYNVTVTSNVNASQPVMLGLSGNPLGSSANLQPIAGVPPYKSRLTVTLGNHVQPGTYMLTVNGTGGGKSHSKTVTLRVKELPDFTLSVSKPEVRVIRGQSISLDVSIQPLHGFNTPVSLSVKNAPAGVTLNFNPTSGVPSLVSKVEIKVDSKMIPGTYPVTIRAAGSSEKEAKIVLNVDMSREESTRRESGFPYGLLIILLLLFAVALLTVRRRRARPKRVEPTKYCIQCGAEIPLDTVYCPKCGVKQP
ncbi:MAG: hypothetical protein QXQ11_06025 [Candidatus Bathyarchaeia archaeon]